MTEEKRMAIQMVIDGLRTLTRSSLETDVVDQCIWPRGTTKAQLEIRCFQSDLRTAIYRFEVKGILSGVRESAERMTMLADDSLSCAEKFSLAKTAQLHSVGAAKAQFEDIELRLSVPLANRKQDRFTEGI